MKSSRFGNIRFILLVCALLFWSIPAESASNSQSDILKKWGVKPGQAGGGDISDSQRRQPMTWNYNYWLAAKFIPGFLDDKTILQAVEDEINYTKKYERYGGPQKPWLPFSEVKDRHVKMAAPEFVDRYKAHMREFTDGLSTRIVGVVKLRCPIYNQSTGMMHFRGCNSPDSYPNPLITNLAGQLSEEQLVAQFGVGVADVDDIARQTAGRKMGMVGAGLKEKVRLSQGVRIPEVFARGKRSDMRAYFAFDKDMDIKGLKMSRREAETFLNKYEAGNAGGQFTARIHFRIKDGFDYSQGATTWRGATFKGARLVFLADVEEVTIISTKQGPDQTGRLITKKTVHATYKASDLKAPTVTLATIKAKYDAKVRATQDSLSKAKQKASQDLARQKQACSESRTVECYQKLCKQIQATKNQQEYSSCYKELLQVQRENAAAARDAAEKEMLSGLTERAQTNRELIKKQKALSTCESRYGGYNAKPWVPAKGTLQYNKAVAACMKESTRTPYGPDILGMRLGMKDVETSDLLRRQQVSKFSALRETRPFEGATLQWTKDNNHGIALFYLRSGESNSKRVAAVSRRLYFADKAPTVKEAVNGLKKKYGAALWSSGERTMLWAFPGEGRRPSAKTCSGLTKLVAPRGGWDKEWSAGTSRSRTRKERRAAAMSAVAPQQQCMAKHGMPSTPEAMMEFRRCIEELAANPAASSQSAGGGGSGARLPFMIKASGAPELYVGYESCGAVTIAHLTTDAAGKLKDMSLVLFDPGWIADQPAFVFTTGGSGGVRGSGGSGIDF